MPAGRVSRWYLAAVPIVSETEVWCWLGALCPDSGRWSRSGAGRSTGRTTRPRCSSSTRDSLCVGTVRRLSSVRDRRWHVCHRSWLGRAPACRRFLRTDRRGMFVAPTGSRMLWRCCRGDFGAVRTFCAVSAACRWCRAGSCTAWLCCSSTAIHVRSCWLGRIVRQVSERAFRRRRCCRRKVSLRLFRVDVPTALRRAYTPSGTPRVRSTPKCMSY